MCSRNRLQNAEKEQTEKSANAEKNKIETGRWNTPEEKIVPAEYFLYFLTIYRAFREMGSFSRSPGHARFRSTEGNTPAYGGRNGTGMGHLCFGTDSSPYAGTGYTTDAI